MGGESNKTTAIEPWLATIAEEAAGRGVDQPDQTIEPHRKPRVSDALALLADLDCADQPLAITETLGRGGMATIRLARQTRLGRYVAVKSLRDDRTDPAFAAELVREAWITGSLEHPNIVPIHDIVLDSGGQPQVVMKRIEGGSWADVLASPTRAPPGDITQLRDDLEILMQVANAVRFAHASNIVHRDLKPANIMIGSFGEVYVVDWGLAVSIDPRGADPRFPRAAEEASKIAGTPAYMAPEMLGGEGAVLDERTDIYLLGAILYEIIAGYPPHRGAKLIEVLKLVQRSEPPMPAHFPTELAALCRRAMAHERSDRHASVAEVIAELRGFLDHLGSARLAAAAALPLGELRQILDADSPDRERVYHLFGECRFGFRAALSAWPENTAARRGLAAAIEALVDHELGCGDVGAAKALLAEHPAPEPTLVERVDRIAGAQRVREQRLAQLEADADPLAGRWVRVAVAVGGSLLWTVFPIVLEYLDFEARTEPGVFRDYAIAISAIWSALLLAMIYLVRGLLRTRFNRVLLLGALSGSIATVLFLFGTRLLELPPQTLPIFLPLLWASVGAVIALAAEKWVWPIVAAMVAAFVVSAIEPELRYWAMAAANSTVGILAIWIWGLGGGTGSLSDSELNRTDDSARQPYR